MARKGKSVMLEHNNVIERREEMEMLPLRTAEGLRAKRHLKHSMEEKKLQDKEYIRNFQELIRHYGLEESIGTAIKGLVCLANGAHPFTKRAIAAPHQILACKILMEQYYGKPKEAVLEEGKVPMNINIQFVENNTTLNKEEEDDSNKNDCVIQ